MSSGTDAAWRTLRQTGQVSLPGAPAIWSGAMRWMFLILMGMVAVAALAPLVVIPIAVIGGVEISVFTVFAVLGFYLMLAAVGVLLVFGYRRQTRYLALERRPVVLEARGLTLRGVGPIPWQDVGPAEHRMVRNENSEGYVQRAVMPLTATGLAAVNEHLTPELRARISPATGPIWNRTHRHVYVPGVEGMGQGEVMGLLNAAHRMFLSAPQHRR